MFLRAILLLLGLLCVPLYPVPAAAIVAACPNGFNNCDPYSGTCYTAWTATLAGQIQANCAADPSACWQQALTSPPACSDPIPPPVNPNAVRVCPPLADCLTEVELAARNYGITFFTPPIPVTWRGPPGSVMRCWSPHYLSPDRIELDALACTVNIYRGLPGFHLPLVNGELPADVDAVTLLSYYVIPDPVLAFEAPGNTCQWHIRPAVPVTPCQLPIATMIAAMKNDSATQWTGLRRYYERLNKRIDRLGWALANGVFGGPATRRYQALVVRQVWLIDLAALIVQLVSDPPNPNYQSFPGPGVFPPLTPLTPDATLTQTQINAIQAWLTLQREAVITGRQLTETIDNLAGALLAAEAGTPGAALWVRNLAVHADTTLAALVTKGLAEIAARAAVVAAGPNVSIPAGPCATPTSAANVLQQAVQGGSTLYQGHLLYQEQLITCGDALSDPAWLASDVADDAALWNSFSTFSVAAYLCTANAAYCAAGAPIATATPPALTFAVTAIGDVAPVQTATVQNTGAAPLIISTVKLVGAHPTQFLKPSDLCSGITLAPGATCTVGVKFFPTVAGPLTADLKVLSNAPFVKVQLAGTGSPAFVAPLALAFGSLAVGGLSANQYVTVRNNGTAPLMLGALAVSGHFKKTTDLCTGVTLAPGQTCTVGLKFKPTSAGAKAGILSIPSIAPTVSVTLTGTGV